MTDKPKQLPSGKAICLVAPGNLASTPRIIKAADALSSAGFNVHVVAGRTFGLADKFDAAILAQANWSCERIAFNRGVFGLGHRIERKVARWLLRHRPTSHGLSTRAHHAGITTLAKAAARHRAALYYGHGGVAGLTIAAQAAQRTNAIYGFDAEDWHEEENTFVQTDSAEHSAVHNLLRSQLNKTAFITCASPRIAEAYAQKYGVAPTCVLNVFPRSYAPLTRTAVPQPTAEQPAIFYWFSQTIGEGRGLEQFIATSAYMRTPVELHLRGFVSDSVRTDFQKLAEAAGRPNLLHFLPPASPVEMIRLAAGSHLGLSLEQNLPRNRDLCLTNKIFTYLLAGVPVLMTPTTAQRELAAKLGSASFLLDGSNDQANAAMIDDWLAKDITTAAQAAWKLGHECYNWDFEQSKLVDAVARALPHNKLNRD
ncbi:MAG: hypothetical protein IPP19_04745 [Verrucomicrobia bacterium]|nr:hypothetical protein [Verrucomicrobiota bacterium]